MLSSEARQVAVVVVAFAAGAALVLVPPGSGPLLFRETPAYPVWGFLIATVCGSCPIVWSHGRRALALLPARRPPVLEALGYGVGVPALIVAYMWVGGVAFSHVSHVRLVDELPHLRERFTIVYLAVALAVAPGIVAMSRVGGASLRGNGRTADLVAWRATLQSQLAALGALVALSTLTTAAFRNAILEAFPGRENEFSAADVLLFGAWLTVFLALVYVPPSERLRRQAQALVDDAFPIPDQFDGDWQQQLQRRRDLAALLRIDETSRSSIQNALIIGGPLITSALTLLIPTR
jgi:hypothetical protein